MVENDLGSFLPLEVRISDNEEREEDDGDDGNDKNNPRQACEQKR